MHFHTCAICADKRQNREIREIKNIGHQEKEGALAIWERGSLSLTAMRPAGGPNGELDITPVGAPDGEWGPPEDRNATGVVLRGRDIFSRTLYQMREFLLHSRARRLLRAPPRRGDRVALSGGVRTEFRMGNGVDATPGHWDTPGRPTRQEPELERGPLGSEN